MGTGTSGRLWSTVDDCSLDSNASLTLWTTLTLFLSQGVSYALRDVPDNIPRRLNIPNTWDDGRTWKSARDMGEVDGWLIAASIVPGIIIAVLYYFDHNISSKLAQQKEYHLKKPPAYHYDFLLLALMTVMCGLLGLPPANGAIPQSPMHTKSLASLKKQLRKRASKIENKKMKISKSTPDLTHLHHTLQQAEIQENAEMTTPMHKASSAQELTAIEKFSNSIPPTPPPASSNADIYSEMNVPAVEVCPWGRCTTVDVAFLDLGQGAATVEFNSVCFSWSLPRTDSNAAGNPQVCSVGILCLHGDCEFAWK